MPTIATHTSLLKNTNTQDDLDYDFLRKTGIAYIEALGGKLWTDFNSHDPGITTLEILSYAITDLGARIALPMEHLLAEENNANYLESQFLTAANALPIKPVTAKDYRKLFIDISGVKNAWLTEHEKTVHVNCKDDLLSYKSFQLEDKHTESFVLNGLYDILIEFDDFDSEHFSTQAAIKKEKKRILEAVRATYHAHRNLCEDVVHISTVEEHPVQVCAIVELYPEAIEEKVHAQILDLIADYLSPSPKFQSLATMLEKGYTTDSIYNGPMLKHGFLEDTQLTASELRTEVRLTDLIEKIQKLEGVDVIRDITINHCGKDAPTKKHWNLCIPKGKKPVLCDKSAFSYFKGFLPLNINQTLLEEYQDAITESKQQDEDAIAALSKELSLPEGTYSNTGDFTTIQNDFPEVFGVGTLGVKSTATVAQRAKAKQLKAYLLFFDQIFATYVGHLNKTKELLSINGTATKSYFSQAVKDVAGLSEIVNGYASDEMITNDLLSDLDDTVARRNKILDHLLSRFAENFSEYAFLMKQLYGANTDEAVIKTKQQLLQNYDMIGCERPLSFNYYKQPETALWDTNNVSAFQKRMALLSGNTNYKRRNFSDDPLEIYEEIDTDGIIEYRFRFRSKSKVILSSASKHYHSLESLYREILDIKNYGRFIDNYDIKKNKAGKFYFNLVNPSVTDTKSESYVIARKIASFKTKANAEKAAEATVKFMNSLEPNEGMYVIEHILLRPDVTKDIASTDSFLPICTDNCDGCEGIDPYSFRVSIVLPGWTERYSNVDFRRFMENLIQKELPAHIMAKICWIGYPKSYDTKGEENEMIELEEAYKAWLFSKTKNGQKQSVTKLKRLNTIMSSLHTIYTQGRLHNCDAEQPETKQNVILGKTNLGKL
ncbi:MAG: hypothetical protein CMC13_12795 [Flavobacteriaceae bacterium]|nr:hypothetical protein [Flavobacteriaceae bacterium]|tara:strand:+ start:802 stop:3465 length:2664 start_codon:yes stop_codon:yes gene_type:complete